MNGEVRINNARIESANIYIERGILTADLILDYGGSGQGFGGYVLFSPSHPDIDVGGRFIYRILETLETDKWSSLSGQIVRARIKDGLAKAIGHPIKNRWFVPADELKSDKATA